MCSIYRIIRDYVEHVFLPDSKNHDCPCDFAMFWIGLDWEGIKVNKHQDYHERKLRARRSILGIMGIEMGFF